MFGRTQHARTEHEGSTISLTSQRAARTVVRTLAKRSNDLGCSSKDVEAMSNGSDAASNDVALLLYSPRLCTFSTKSPANAAEPQELIRSSLLSPHAGWPEICSKKGCLIVGCCEDDDSGAQGVHAKANGTGVDGSDGAAMCWVRNESFPKSSFLERRCLD